MLNPDFSKRNSTKYSLLIPKIVGKLKLETDVKAKPSTTTNLRIKLIEVVTKKETLYSITKNIMFQLGFGRN
jgi:hypothetical protein